MTLNLQFNYQMKVLLAGLACGFLSAMIVSHAIEYLCFEVPLLGKNTNAYAHILRGMEAGKYRPAKYFFDTAYSISDDPKIRYVAELNSRACDYALQCGIDSFEEAESFEGGIKGFVLGFTNPISSLSAADILIKIHFGDYKSNCEYLDARYMPRVFLIKLFSNSSFWILIVGTPIVFIRYFRNQESHPYRFFLQRLLPMPPNSGFHSRNNDKT